jgi:hypothetical protein
MNVSERNKLWPVREIRAADFAALNHRDGWALEIEFGDTPIGRYSENLDKKFKRARFPTPYRRGARTKRKATTKTSKSATKQRNRHLTPIFSEARRRELGARL